MNLLCIVDPFGVSILPSKVGRIFASPYRPILDTITNTLKCSIYKEWPLWVLFYCHCIQLACSFLKDSKSMQDGWGENDGPVAGTRHPSWEEEDDGGVWNTAGSQGSASSHNSASWGQGGKKQMKVGRIRNIWTCLFILRRQNWECFGGRSHVAEVLAVLSDGEHTFFRTHNCFLFTPSLPSLEVSNYKILTLDKMEFSKKQDFSFHFNFHIIIIL